jgi:hypothetical protein
VPNQILITFVAKLTLYRFARVLWLFTELLPILEKLGATRFTELLPILEKLGATLFTELLPILEKHGRPRWAAPQPALRSLGLTIVERPDGGANVYGPALAGLALSWFSRGAW